MIVPFKIYYTNSVYVGSTQADWEAMPDTDVQVIVCNTPWDRKNFPDRFQTGFVVTPRLDKMFYTGVDTYDPMGTGSFKAGSMLTNSNYFHIWEIAYQDG